MNFLCCYKDRNQYPTHPIYYTIIIIKKGVPGYNVETRVSLKEAERFKKDNKEGRVKIKIMKPYIE